MNLIADTHTHTIACDHAYSTLTENAAVAAQKGLCFLAMTEHGPGMPGGPTTMHFGNLRAAPSTFRGVTILKGAEVNIMDYEGALDLPDMILERLDWVIASMHIPTLSPGTREEHTAGWLAVAENPLVDVIGHCGDGRYPFDEERVVKAFAAGGKIVEINSHSFAVRPGSRESCPRIARLCAKEGVRVVVNSDAHYCDRVGEFSNAVEMLESIHFPEHLIINADRGRFLTVAKEKAGPATKEQLQLHSH